MNEIDYGQFIETVNRNVDNQLVSLNQPGVSVEVTGGVPLIYKAQRQILGDLTLSFVTAFVLITLVLMFVIRSFRAGLIAMLPNVFPPLMVFGTMGWLGTSIEIDSFPDVVSKRHAQRSVTSRVDPVCVQALCQSNDRHVVDLWARR